MVDALPTNELVAQAWVALVVDAVTDDVVATTLPRDATAWAANGFIQVQAVAGRTVDLETKRRLPVIQLDGWANNGTGQQPPWHLANQLVERVRVATEYTDLRDAAWLGKLLTMPKPNYEQARVWGVYPLTEPTRVLGDPSGYARFTLDLAIDWARA